jgi:hypothetical protein
MTPAFQQRSVTQELERSAVVRSLDEEFETWRKRMESGGRSKVTPGMKVRWYRTYLIGVLLELRRKGKGIKL